jgi:hypothetical protein
MDPSGVYSSMQIGSQAIKLLHWVKTWMTWFTQKNKWFCYIAMKRNGGAKLFPAKNRKGTLNMSKFKMLK